MNFILALLISVTIAITSTPTMAKDSPALTGVSCETIARLKPRMTTSQVRATIGNAPIKNLDDYPTWYSIQIGSGDSFDGPIARVQISKIPQYKDLAVGAIVYGCGPKNTGWFL